MKSSMDKFVKHMKQVAKRSGCTVTDVKNTIEEHKGFPLPMVLDYASTLLHERKPGLKKDDLDVLSEGHLKKGFKENEIPILNVQPPMGYKTFMTNYMPGALGKTTIGMKNLVRKYNEDTNG